MILAQDYFEKYKNNYFYYFNVPTDFNNAVIRKTKVAFITCFDFFIKPAERTAVKPIKKFLKDAPNGYQYTIKYKYDESTDKLQWYVTGIFSEENNEDMRASEFLHFTSVNHLPIPEIMTGNWVFNTLGENSKNGILDVNDGFNDFSTKYGHKIILLKV